MSQTKFEISQGVVLSQLSPAERKEYARKLTEWKRSLSMKDCSDQLN